MTSEPDASDAGPDLQALLSVLGDADCRRILRVLDRPKTAKELMTTCDLSQTTTYRKLDRLSETALVGERTELRDDGHHATSYERTVEGVYVDLDLDFDEDDRVGVRLVESTDDEAPDERLAHLWSRVSEEL